MTNSPIQNLELHNYLYFVFDKLSGAFHEFTLAPNDTIAVRNVLLTLRVPLKDSLLYKFGEITGSFDPASESLSLSDFNIVFFDNPELVSWACYKFPETVAESLSDLGMTKSELESFIHNNNKR